MPSTASFLPRLCAALAVLFGATAAAAQPAPSLTGAAPIYLRQAESQDVTVAGANLAGASAVFLTDARGLTAQLLPDDKPAANRVKLRLAAASDAALGLREMRVVTPLGVTPPLAVAVGQYAALRDDEANKHPADRPQPTTFPATIVGRIETPGDADAFRFDAKKGQRLVFDVYAARLNGPLDPVVTILDDKAREQPRTLAARPAGDTAVLFDVPADGAYTLVLRDVQYRGGNDYAYRVDAGQIPLVESILPAGGRRGTKVEVRAVGHNLGDNPVTTVDLTTAAAGTTEVRFKTPFGWSNDVPFVVTDVQQVAEKAAGSKDKDPKDKDPKKKDPKAKPAPTPVSLPAEVSGVLAEPGEEDVYKFSVPTKQALTIEVQARRIGSAVDALLTLRDAAGNVLDQNNGAGDAEARVSRAFEPGDYTVSVRDLTFAGGPGYGYRLNLFQAGGVPADFYVRFMPDAVRVPRGGHAKVWCEVVRLNGYKGDVAVTLDGLPAGVSISNGPATLSESTSGVFTLSASADAAVASAPVTLKATGSFGAQRNSRVGEPEANNRVVRGAYVSVIDPPPFSLDALAQVKPEQIAAYGPEVQRLTAKLTGDSPEVAAAQAAWEKSIDAPVEWQPLVVSKVVGTGGAEFRLLPDGSVLATNGGYAPEKDTYTVTATATVAQITAVRLEALTDPSLPQTGPGKKDVNGNFVLNRFTVTVAPKGDPAKATPIKFTAAKATFAQPNYGPNAAIEEGSKTGWAIMGGTSQPQTAWFFTDKPVPAGDVVFTVALDQQYGERHVLGRFRLAVTGDPAVRERQGDTLPAPVAVAMKIPADKRTPEQRSVVSTYYRSVAPELAADRQALERLRSTVGPFAEVARLQAALEQNSPAIDAERKEWEASASAGLGWSPVDVTAAKSAAGTQLNVEKDGSVVALGPVPPAETYTLTTSTTLRAITAIRLEAIPDDRLPASGPGRMGDGNFILTRFAVSATAKNAQAAGGDKTGPVGGTVGPVTLRAARANYEQQGWPIAGALDEKPDTGWAVSPLMGRSHAATFYPKVPIAGPEGGTALTFTLEFASPQYPGSSLGRVRIWVLGAADVDTAPRIPAEIAEILKISETYRTDAMRAEFAAYYRSISPALEPTRQRLAELKAQLPSLQVTVARNKSITIPVPLARADGFTAPIQVTLEGFSAGRDPQTRQPTAATKNLDVQPLTVNPGQPVGRLTIKARTNSDLGTRMAVLRAEAKVGNDTFVSYSPAFPVTVVEK